MKNFLSYSFLTFFLLNIPCLYSMDKEKLGSEKVKDKDSKLKFQWGDLPRDSSYYHNPHVQIKSNFDKSDVSCSFLYIVLHICKGEFGKDLYQGRFAYAPFFYSFPKKFETPFVISYGLYPEKTKKLEIVHNKEQFSARKKENFKFKNSLKLYSPSEVVQRLRKHSVFVHASPSRPWIYDYGVDSYSIDFFNKKHLHLPLYIVYMLNKKHVVETIATHKVLRERLREDFVYRDGLKLENKDDFIDKRKIRH